MHKNKGNFRLPAAILVIMALLQAGCKTDPEFRILEISGADAVYNISRSWIYFGSHADSARTVFVAAGEGDLLYVWDENSEQATFLMNDKNLENNPELRFDTLNFIKFFFLNGDTYSADLTDGSVPPALSTEDRETVLADVKSLYLKLPLSDDLSGWLETSLPPDRVINLAIEGEDSANQLEGLLEYFNPQWLFMADLDIPYTGIGPIAGLQEIRFLAVSHKVFTSRELSANLPSLVSLIISGESEGPFSSLSFTGIPKLKTLTITDVAHADISWFESASNLENLFLINVDSISSAERLASMSRLKGLGFTGSEWAGELPHLRRLRWMSAPRDISQEAFDQWCSNPGNIKVLEITHNSNITDLTPVSNLSGLEVLMLDVPEASLDPLRDMSQLRLLVIEHDRYEESAEQIAALKNALPQTRIVPGGGFCLGSGWIMLLIPFLVLAIAAGGRKRT